MKLLKKGFALLLIMLMISTTSLVSFASEDISGASPGLAIPGGEI